MGRLIPALVVPIVLGVALLPSAGAQAPNASKRWLVRVTEDGGIAGIHKEMSIDSDGRLRSTSAGPAACPVALSDVQRIEAVVARSRPNAWQAAYIPKGGTCCDQIGVTFHLELEDDRGRRTSHDTSWFSATAAAIPNDLADLFTIVNAPVSACVPPSFVGSWWQSAWKLCKPVAQLTASEADPPIDDLVFRKDGTFSVTWRGGGAHTGDIPHVFVPDYSGHFTVDPVGERVHLRIDNGLFVPGDFAGDGVYRLTDRELTLTRVWFGTRRAKQKPDICELTFTRKSPS